MDKPKFAIGQEVEIIGYDSSYIVRGVSSQVKFPSSQFIYFLERIDDEGDLMNIITERESNLSMPVPTWREQRDTIRKLIGKGCPEEKYQPRPFCNYSCPECQVLAVQKYLKEMLQDG